MRAVCLLLVMESKQAQVARILNSTSSSFFSGLDKDDQTSLFRVLEDYFYDRSTDVMHKINAAVIKTINRIAFLGENESSQSESEEPETTTSASNVRRVSAEKERETYDPAVSTAIAPTLLSSLPSPTPMLLSLSITPPLALMLPLPKEQSTLQAPTPLLTLDHQRYSSLQPTISHHTQLT